MHARPASLRLPRWWLLAIVIIQGLVATLEAIAQHECARGIVECWAFFSDFVLNLPLSIYLLELTAKLPGWLGISSNGDAFAVSSAVVFFVGGSLWWIAVSVFLKAMWLAVTGVTRRVSAYKHGDV